MTVEPCALVPHPTPRFAPSHQVTQAVCHQLLRNTRQSEQRRCCPTCHDDNDEQSEPPIAVKDAESQECLSHPSISSHCQSTQEHTTQPMILAMAHQPPPPVVLWPSRLILLIPEATTKGKKEKATRDMHHAPQSPNPSSVPVYLHDAQTS